MRELNFAESITTQLNFEQMSVIDPEKRVLLQPKRMEFAINKISSLG